MAIVQLEASLESTCHQNEFFLLPKDCIMFAQVV